MYTNQKQKERNYIVWTETSPYKPPDASGTSLKVPVDSDESSVNYVVVQKDEVETVALYRSLFQQRQLETFNLIVRPRYNRLTQNPGPLFQ